jgi:hypothetical protein
LLLPPSWGLFKLQGWSLTFELARLTPILPLAVLYTAMHVYIIALLERVGIATGKFNGVNPLNHLPVRYHLGRTLLILRVSTNYY